MKIALAQLNYHIGNFPENTLKIIESIRIAKNEGTDLIIFSELAVCGYPPRDFLLYSDFIQECNQSIAKIAEETKDIAVIIGAPIANPAKKGKKLQNAALFINEKKIQKTVVKTLLPTYDIFDEYRYFEPNSTFELIEFKGKKIALTICEDLWNVDNNPIYKLDPMAELAALGSDLIINIAASPFCIEQQDLRLKVLEQNAIKYKQPLIYVNQVGAQTELIFDGNSLVLSSDGKVRECLKAFKEDLHFFNFENINNAAIINYNSDSVIKKIHDALCLGIEDYFKKSKLNKAIIGLSGGIDSAVVTVLAVRALGAQNVHCLLMPSQFSSDHSIHDAENLAKNLGISYDIIPISNAFKTFELALAPLFKGLPFTIAEENIQARTRAIFLMAYSNKFGHILLNTSNKSEAAVGYGTLYGDMCGGLSVIGDVFKTDVFKLAKFINIEEEIIPINTIIKPPSAELRPNQKDSDSLPDYEILDQILKAYIEDNLSSLEIENKGFDKETVLKILGLVNMSEHKRHQAPPILRVSKRAFGQGRRMPIVGNYKLK